jgi:hypothetical protein
VFGGNWVKNEYHGTGMLRVFGERLGSTTDWVHGLPVVDNDE